MEAARAWQQELAVTATEVAAAEAAVAAVGKVKEMEVVAVAWAVALATAAMPEACRPYRDRTCRREASVRSGDGYNPCRNLEARCHCRSLCEG